MSTPAAESWIILCFGKFDSVSSATQQSQTSKVMAPNFLKRLLEILCRHQFSWPHSGICGRDYQVCVLCGIAYEYDWVTMRRTRRLKSVLQDQAESNRGQ